MDGVDGALVRFTGGEVEVLAADCLPYPDKLATALKRAIAAPETLNVIDLGRLDAAVGDHFAVAAKRLTDAAGCAPGDLAAIGSHGQTIYHDVDARPVISQQIGDPNRIAEALGVPVVADFRRRDTIAGGQGAPLASALHAAYLRDPQEDRAVLNLGGIANLTLMPAEASAPVSGFDTGPANCLMDEWIARHQQASYDDNGVWAAAGRVDEQLLERWLADSYFERPPPKSTGREHFNLGWATREEAVAGLPPEDVQATLATLTAESIARALQANLPGCRRVLTCGGGVHNEHLMATIEQRLKARVDGDMRLESSACCGLDPDWVEAILFAWLARQTLAGRPGNLPSVTGAAGPRVLGAVYSGSR